MSVASETPIVLVHGWAGSSAVWIPIRRALERSGHQAPVVAIDLPGSPLTGPTDRDATIASATRHVIEHLEREGVPSLLVGHSMGAQVTLLAQATRPELVTSEVVLDPAYNSTESPATLRRWAQSIESGGHGVLVSFFERGLGRDVPAPDAAQVLSDVVATSIPVILSYLRSEYLDEESIGLLPATIGAAARRQRPVLAFHTTTAGARLEEQLPAPPGSSTRFLRGLHHFLHLERPADIVAELQGWLSQLPGRTRIGASR